ncbi:hem peroxidase - like 10 [Theobroma cacao]|nr:hem peroxidase - like 10 [Theobroma cacao]
MAAGQKLLSFLLFQLILVLLVLDLSNAEGLKLGYYYKTCPKAESIIRKTTYRQSEKAAVPNLSLQGFHVIDAVKSAVEEACPGVVSCADTLALVARDSVSMIYGPFWEVPLGRRDGRVSLLNEAFANLPSPFANITTLKQMFAVKGLSLKDLAVLSGDTDPSMDPNYIVKLKKKCKPADTTTLVEMDPGSFKNFDEDYFTLVAKRRGLFQSDAALLNDKETKAYVILQSSTHGSTFGKDFAESMVKMGKVGVLTGHQGEIRKHCAVVN